jgi:hypothetical protein
MVYETAALGNNLDVPIGRVSYLATSRISNRPESCQPTEPLTDLTAA